MILINLLPHREEKRKRRRTAYYIGLGMSAVAGVAAVGIWFVVLEAMKSSQDQRNAFLGSEIKKLEAQIKDIANLRAEIDALKARQKAVEDLQADRNVPVHLLNELVKQTPEGVYLTSIKQAGQVVTVVGVAQSNLKRMLAYSSIAHAGFILMGVSSPGQGGMGAALFYLAAYAAMILGAFGVVLAIEGRDGGSDLDAFRGLGRRDPLLAGLLATFLLSMAGIPPLAGFAAKLQVFSAAVGAGRTWLVLVGVLASVAAAFFYLRLVVRMYMEEPEIGRAHV